MARREAGASPRSRSHKTPSWSSLRIEYRNLANQPCQAIVMGLAPLCRAHGSLGLREDKEWIAGGGRRGEIKRIKLVDRKTETQACTFLFHSFLK